MNNKARWFWQMGLLVAMLAVVAACGSGNNAGGDGSNAAAPTATVEVPADIPILEGAEGLRVTSNGSQISYEVVANFDEAVKFYQDELLALGWEQKSKKDSGFANNITLLRNNAKSNLSVTIQTVSGSDKLRISITRVPK